MGVVDLDGSVVRQVVIVAAPGGALRQNQLGTGGDHQVLLINPQLTACLIGVIGVQEQGQVFVDGSLVEGNALPDDAFIHGVDIEQVQGVGAALIARHRQLVKPCGEFLPAQLDRVGDVCLFCPAVFCQPGVGQLLLHAAGQRLVEQAEMIPQANTVTRQIQGSQGIQEAGRQTAQTAVAKRRLRLHLFNLGKLLSGGLQGRAYFVIQPKIDQVIRQQLTDEKFRADIIQLPALYRADLLGGLLVYQLQKGKIQLAVGAFTKGFSCQCGERVCHSHERVPPFLSVYPYYTTNIL